MNENPNYPADDKDIPVDLPKDPEIPAEPLFEPMDNPPEFKVNIKEDTGDDMTDLFELASEDDDGETPDVNTANGPVKKKLDGNKKKKENRLLYGGCAKSLIYAVVIIGVSLLLSFVLLLGINDMVGLVKPNAEVTITIPEGATTDQVVQIVKDSGAVSQPLFFKLYMSLTKSTEKIEPGEYTINTNYDYMRIISSLKGAGATYETVELNFPEGFTLEQIVDRLVENGVNTREALMNSLQNTEFEYDLVKDIPTDDPNRLTKLEGYLFPDTYEFYKGEAPDSVIGKFLANTEKKITAEMREQAKASGMTVDELLTLASVIQEESGEYEQMLKISSVFHNRLNSREFPRLESDPTTEYAQAHNAAAYDTYQVAGLMPGPICNPGIEAILAALTPDNTNYLFFVTDLKGNYYYATTYNAHLKNIQTAEAIDNEVKASSGQ